MQRRTFVKKSSLTLIGMGVFGSLLSNNKRTGAGLMVNGKRIESRIFELAKFGRDENGHGYRGLIQKATSKGGHGLWS